MKQNIKRFAAALALSLITLCTFAQDEQPSIPDWVSDKGHWVVETNAHSPLNHIIWFYNNDNVLVYKETLTGVKLNLERRKTKMKLKRVLESSVTAWESKKVSTEEKAWVKMAFK
jgi:hypothetical protein